MRKASWAIAVLVLLSTFHLAITILPDNARAVTLYVGGSGPGNYTKIQSAIDAALPGDTIFVYIGTYNEAIYINRSLTLTGENMYTTVIDGGGLGNVVTVDADWSNISGFAITTGGGGIYDAGISLEGVNNCTIQSNQIANSKYGIRLSYSHGNSIADNVIGDNYGAGIGLYHSNQTSISNNTVWNNPTGIYVWSSHNNSITDSVASSNTARGFDLQYSSWNSLTGIRIIGGVDGLFMDRSDYNTMRGIHITDTTRYGVYLNLADWNTFANAMAQNNIQDDFYLAGSNNNSFHNITPLSNGEGFSLFSSDGNAFDLISSGTYTMEQSDHNSVSNCTDLDYLFLSNSGNNTFTNLNFTADSGGIYVDQSAQNTFSYIDTGFASIGMSLYESDLNIISNSTFDHNYKGIRLYYSDSNIVSNNTINRSQSYGISVEYSKDNFLADNTMTLGGVFMDGSGWYEFWNSHSIDTSNTVNGKPVIYWKNVVGGSVPSGGGQVILGLCWNVVIEHQTFSDVYMGVTVGASEGVVVDNVTTSDTQYGIGMIGTYKSALVNSVASNSWLDGIIVRGAMLNLIANNTFVSNWRHGAFISSAETNYIINNTASQNRWEGMYIYKSIWNTVRGNTAILNSKHGIVLESSGANVLESNTATFNEYGGFSLRGSSGNTIIGNNISSNFQFTIPSFGVELRQGSEDNILLENNFSANKGDGVHLSSNGNRIGSNKISSNGGIGVNLGSIGNTIVANNISKNEWGIVTGFSGLNSIYHNNITDNVNQAYDGSDAYQWDDGYPSGGNYWGDYNGSDWYSGPNQDQPGSDGIGDTPYVIDADSQDRYPLIAPFGILLPMPPTLTKVVLSGGNLENVTLSWILSDDDGAGNASVVGYKVFRSQTYDSSGSGYGLICLLPNGTSEYIDAAIGEGDPNNYFYRVCSVDSNNNTRCARDQGAKFTQYMNSGVNLISIPVAQSDENISAVLQTLSYTEAWSYDSVIGEWISFSAQKPHPSRLKTVNHANSIWVNVDVGSNLTLAGIVPFSTSICLVAGWNLVGFPSFNMTYPVAELTAQAAATRVEGFDGFSPPYFLRHLSNDETLLPGSGYWVWVDSDTVWTVTNS